jgi:hypothetical protein
MEATRGLWEEEKHEPTHILKDSHWLLGYKQITGEGCPGGRETR